MPTMYQNYACAFIDIIYILYFFQTTRCQVNSVCIYVIEQLWHPEHLKLCSKCMYVCFQGNGRLAFVTCSHTFCAPITFDIATLEHVSVMLYFALEVAISSGKPCSPLVKEKL